MNRADLQREKLLQAVVFFVENTKVCHKLKLLKLLFLLDFEVYRETGRTVTGLEYYAWPMGPVARTLYEELESPHPDLLAAVSITTGATRDPDFGSDAMLIFKARHTFNEACFTGRELAKMKRIAEVYKTAPAKAMTDVTHAPGTPWHQVYKIEGRHQARIPPTLALDDKSGSVTKEQADLVEDEERELAALFE